ncbi:MAG TPA: carbamoyltransferase C-terminal domain-containing protein [bacterium]|nr:carbamoyltransferase C-terminal domain-containing protein [bacterium]
MAAYLGLSGWPGWGHDPAACLVVDGRLVAAVEEERLVRQRHAFGRTPVNAIACCLDHAGFDLGDIDAVGVAWNGIDRYEQRGLRPPDRDEIVGAFLPAHLLNGRRRPPVRFLDHHECHAWSAVWSWPNGGADAAVLVLDGQGDAGSGASFHWRHGRLERLEDHEAEVSLGYLFEAGCAYAGFGFHHAGKLMALAAMGEADPSSLPLVWREGQAQAPFGPVTKGADGRPFEAVEIVERCWLPWLYATFGDPEPLVGDFDRTQRTLGIAALRGQRQLTVAATLQACLEDIVLQRARRIVAQTGESNLCYSGGVALNCVANGRLTAAPWLDGITIPPAANDAGTAIGAAMILADETDVLKPLDKMPFWGPPPSDIDIAHECDRLGLAAAHVDDPADECARAIELGQVVARCAGALEYGPRALGHRSLLAGVVSREIADRINSEIKGRELWRPFGVALTRDAAGTHLQDARDLPHMLVAARVADSAGEALAAVTHVDRTTRPQTVLKGDETGLWEILQAVGRATGVEAVVNTSFNAAGLPLVATLRHAVADAFATPIDLMLVGDVVVKRRAGRPS